MIDHYRISTLYLLKNKVDFLQLTISTLGTLSIFKYFLDLPTMIHIEPELLYQLYYFYFIEPRLIQTNKLH
jgi:hypothetical protein